MSTLEQEIFRQRIIEHLDAQRPGARLRIHLEDLFIAVPASFIELRKALGQTGTQLIEIDLMNDWLRDSGYHLRTVLVEHDANGSWAVIEKAG